MSPSQLDMLLPLLAVPAAIAAIILFINLILRAVAWLGGWNGLARAYPGRPQAGGETWRFRSLRFGLLAAYNNCVTLGGDREGLHLSMPWFIRGGHEPIFVPWSEMAVLGKKDSFGFSVVTLGFRKCPSVKLSLSAGLLAEIQASVKE